MAQYRDDGHREDAPHFNLCEIIFFQTCPYFLSTEQVFLLLWQHERSSLPYLEFEIEFSQNIMVFINLCMEHDHFWPYDEKLLDFEEEASLFQLVRHRSYWKMSNWYESSSKSHYLIPPETPPSMKLTNMLSFAFGAILYLCFIWKKFLNKIWINSQFWVTKWSKCALI